MQQNLGQLQSCFVSFHSHLTVQAKSLELDLLWVPSMGKYLREGLLLPGRLQMFGEQRMLSREMLFCGMSLEPEATFSADTEGAGRSSGAR